MKRTKEKEQQQPINIDELCAMVEGGYSLAQCAAKLGKSRQCLYEWIKYDPLRSARVNQSRILSAHAIIERTRENLESAKDPFELAKAKEIAHHDRWYASKIAPRDYGDKVAITGDDGGPLKISISQSDSNLL